MSDVMTLDELTTQILIERGYSDLSRAPGRFNTQIFRYAQRDARRIIESTEQSWEVDFLPTK